MSVRETHPTKPTHDELDALLAKASDGPWEAGSNAYGCNFVYGRQRETLVCGGNNHDTLTVEDAVAIAAIFNSAPSLLAQARAAEVMASGGEEHWHRVVATIGPILKAAFPEAHSVTRLQAAQAIATALDQQARGRSA